MYGYIGIVEKWNLLFRVQGLGDYRAKNPGAEIVKGPCSIFVRSQTLAGIHKQVYVSMYMCVGEDRGLTGLVHTCGYVCVYTSHCCFVFSLCTYIRLCMRRCTLR